MLSATADRREAASLVPPIMRSRSPPGPGTCAEDHVRASVICPGLNHAPASIMSSSVMSASTMSTTVKIMMKPIRGECAYRLHRDLHRERPYVRAMASTAAGGSVEASAPEMPMATAATTSSAAAARARTPRSPAAILGSAHQTVPDREHDQQHQDQELGCDEGPRRRCAVHSRHPAAATPRVPR